MSTFITNVVVLIGIVGLFRVLDKFMLDKLDKTKLDNRIIEMLVLSTLLGIFAALVITLSGNTWYWGISIIVYILLIGTIAFLTKEFIFMATSNEIVRNALSLISLALLVLLVLITEERYISIMGMIGGQVPNNKLVLLSFGSFTTFITITKQIAKNKPSEQG